MDVKLQVNNTISLTPANSWLMQRSCACDKERPTLQRRFASQMQFSSAPPIVHDVLRSTGEPLDQKTRTFMEPRFGHDFGRVRVHKDDRAARSAESVGALAYTVGHDIVFGSGNYAPATAEGKSLLAHELAHVMQQAGIGSSDKLPIGSKDSVQERESMEIAASAARWKPVSAHSLPELQLLRATHMFSLTFDDGPHAATLNKGINRTEKVLDTLNTKGIKAAFFVQTEAEDTGGNKFRADTPVGKKLIKRMTTEGHIVGIHTGGTIPHETHPSAQKAGRLEGELKDAKSFIKTETGVEPTLVRPPEGKFDKDVQATYAKVGLSMRLWDIVGDIGCKSLSDLKNQMDGEIRRVAVEKKWQVTTPSRNLVILYHDLNQATSDNLGDMIEYIKTDTEKISTDEAKSAQDKADAAKKEADTARKTADTAKKTAEAAKDNKDAAKKADEAEKKAEAAKIKAESAKEKAEATKKEIGPGDFAPL